MDDGLDIDPEDIRKSANIKILFIIIIIVGIILIVIAFILLQNHKIQPKYWWILAMLVTGIVISLTSVIFLFIIN